MKEFLGRLFNVRNLVMLSGIMCALGSAYLFVDKLFIPWTLKKYGIQIPEAQAMEKTEPKKEVAAEVKKRDKAADKVEKEAPRPKEKGKKKEKGGEIGPVFNLNPIIVNVAGSDARRYLKAQIVFELSKEKLAEEIEKRSPQIYNVLIDILSSYRVEDITENNGKERIRSEVMNRINLILTSGTIVNVYLSELVIQ